MRRPVPALVAGVAVVALLAGCSEDPEPTADPEPTESASASESESPSETPRQTPSEEPEETTDPPASDLPVSLLDWRAVPGPVGRAPG